MNNKKFFEGMRKGKKIKKRIEENGGTFETLRELREELQRR